MCARMVGSVTVLRSMVLEAELVSLLSVSLSAMLSGRLWVMDG